MRVVVIAFYNKQRTAKLFLPRGFAKETFQFDAVNFKFASIIYEAVTVKKRNNAIVVGGSFAGLMTAKALSRHYKQVIIIEKDIVNRRPEARKGQPQNQTPSPPAAPAPLISSTVTSRVFMKM